MKHNHIFATAIAILLLSLFSITCFASENASYEITWTYTAENLADKDLSRVPFWFDKAEKHKALYISQTVA
ncbi:MAG: hypothetical protein LBM98_08685 [Oscillospiraceae bacterium]|nr:hypothetical protein [Oscillospiraceae bacterium]